VAGRRPPGEELTEPPVGFSVNYYNKEGLRGYALDLRLHDKRSPELIKEILYQAYRKICVGIQPRGPLGDTDAPPPAPANLDEEKMRRGIRAALEAEGGMVTPATNVLGHEPEDAA
jgi:hypothetical protein